MPVIPAPAAIPMGVIRPVPAPIPVIVAGIPVPSVAPAPIRVIPRIPVIESIAPAPIRHTETEVNVDSRLVETGQTTGIVIVVGIFVIFVGVSLPSRGITLLSVAQIERVGV